MLPAGIDARLATPGETPEVSALPGRYAVPGLVDAHAHLTVRNDRTLGDLDLAQARLDAYATEGVGHVRDVGGRSEVTLQLAAANRPGSPKVDAAGRFLAPAGRYFPGMHDPVAGPDLGAAIAQEVSRGAAWLKLIGDFPHLVDGSPAPGTLAPTYELEIVREAVETAHLHGARVAVHTQSEHVVDLVSTGVDSVEHGEWLTEDAVRALGARGGAWTPTLAAITDPGPDATDRRRRYAEEASERLRQLLPLAVASGVTVLAGTDLCGSVAHEIALLASHGLSPIEAIAAGSTSAESWLAGTASPDSIVTYDADPRSDPTVLATPVAVVVNGRRVL